MLDSSIRPIDISYHSSNAEMASASLGFNGYANSGHGDLGGGGGSGQQPWPHISDVISVSPGVDTTIPIRKLLETGDNHLRQADTLRSFGRKPQALKEYLRGSIIAIQVIPRHRDYPDLRAGPSSRLYDALKSKVSSQHSTFEAIKQEIIYDNERTGVEPTSRPKPHGIGNGYHSPTSTTRPSASHVGGSPTKTKPVVHPKPPSLHGNLIQRSTAPAADATSDLSSRFANLGGPMSRPQQDPRIKTQPIPLTKETQAAGAERLPKLGLVSDLPGLPKVPDAIYSPARGTVSTEAGQLPSSTTRGLFSRTGSSTAFPNVPLSPNPPPSQPPPPPPPPVPSQPNGLHKSAAAERVVKPSTLSMPGDTIRAQDLLDLMRAGSGGSGGSGGSSGCQILMIDVRPRDQFDDGHIMWQSIMCIEPSVLLRESISADEIAESNVLAPQEEIALFDKRESFDLVVYYDQSSESVATKTFSERNFIDDQAKALVSLQRALIHFNYKKDLRNPPKLLRGGIDAWTDILGTHSLATSSTGNISALTSKRASKPLPKGLGVAPKSRRRQGLVIKSLRPDEIQQWQETLKQTDMETAESPGFLRSTDDFLRRFPPVLPEQESMTSPVNGISANMAEIASRYSDLPSPPTRPAPTVPRPSYSGLGDGLSAQPPHIETRAAVAQAQAKPARKSFQYTGLLNPGNWCYANSIIQALLASRGFAGEMAKIKTENNWPLPTTDPQLMLKILGNLLMWMSTGSIDVLRAQTVMDYSRSIHDIKDVQQKFGGKNQQDAEEFTTFLFTCLHGETNLRCATPPGPRPWWSNETTPTDARNHRFAANPFDAVCQFWQWYDEGNQSIVSKYFTSASVRKTECHGCGTEVYTPDISNIFSLALPDGVNSITDALSRSIEPQSLLVSEQNGKKCDSMACQGSTRDATSTTYLGRLPELFVMTLKRFQLMRKGSDQAHKDTRRVDFDPDYLDLEPYVVPSSYDQSNYKKQLCPTLKYECYAIVVHNGSTINSGHYLSYIRNDKVRERGRWLKCSDATITETELNTGTKYDALETLLTSSTDNTPYMLFYRRKTDGVST